MQSLLKKLQIPVCYSREHYDRIQSKVTFQAKHWEIEVGCNDIGMKVGKLSDGTLHVLSMGKTGQIAAWNAEHSDESAVRVGDTILEVNGRRESLINEMQTSRKTLEGRLKMAMARYVPDRNPNL